jgi:hypothetical protein
LNTDLSVCGVVAEDLTRREVTLRDVYALDSLEEHTVA